MAEVENQGNQENPYIKISDLSAEQQQRILDVPGLEAKTTEVFALRHQLTRFYRLNRDYLPVKQVETRKNKKGEDVQKVVAMRVRDIYEAVTGGKKLEEVISFEKIESEVDALPLSDREKRLTKAWRRLHFSGEVKRALETYGALREKGGDWKEEEADTPAREYYRMRVGEVGKAMEVLAGLKRTAGEREDLLDIARSDSAFPISPEDVEAIDGDYRAQLEAVHKLASKHPEAYLTLMGLQLKEVRGVFDQNGRIVETPYVIAKKERILDIVLVQHRPVFIHGELGCGKTELAKHVCRTELSKPYLARWDEEHPKPQDPQYLKIWEAQRREGAEALVVSGHRQIDTSELIGSRGISRIEQPSPEEQLNMIRQRWEEYKNRMIGEGLLGGENVDELAKRLEDKDRPLYERAWIEVFRSPVETRAALGPLLKAQKQGRPLIIDEVNGIPHHVLIVMNDLIMRRPGETIVPPLSESEPFVVKDGFCVILTGNYKPEDSVLYVGRSPIDAAFLSRLGVVSYDFLPEEREMESPGTPPERLREIRIQNELFHMLVTRLLSEDLTATLPEGSLDKIKRLAYVARNLQDAFSGHQTSQAWWAEAANGGKVEPNKVLKENILSIRHILPILDQWAKDGFRRDLDDYLFLEYVARSDARPEEKVYLYSILQVQGDFFQAGKGWPRYSERGNVLAYPIDTRMYEVDRVTGMKKPLPVRDSILHTYSPIEIITELYGPPPERTELPREYVEGKKPETAKNEETLMAGDWEYQRILDKMVTDAQRLKDAGYSLEVPSKTGQS